jgi:hypothetical protein
MAASLHAATPPSRTAPPGPVQRVLLALPALVAVAILVGAAWIGWRYEHPSMPVACAGAPTTVPASVGPVLPASGSVADPSPAFEALDAWIGSNPADPPVSRWRAAYPPHGQPGGIAAFVNTTYEHGHAGHGDRGVVIGHVAVATGEAVTGSRPAITTVIATC